jgi:hypothetical protein
MKIPDNLYNPYQADQSLQGYIDAYDDTIEMLVERLESRRLIGDFSKEDHILGLELCFKINIYFRMIQILENHCEQNCELTIS